MGSGREAAALNCPGGPLSHLSGAGLKLTFTERGGPGDQPCPRGVCLLNQTIG